MFKKLSHEESILLERAFTVEEIKHAIWCCGSDKAPRLDGFTFQFFKSYWNVINDEIMRFVNFFEQREFFQGV